jgi:hypothetical protein
MKAESLEELERLLDGLSPKERKRACADALDFLDSELRRLTLERAAILRAQQEFMARTQGYPSGYFPDDPLAA